MSAIYGAIDLNRNAIDKDLPARFDAGYTKCKIDKNNSLLKDNVYLHCGVQYFYPRAKAEKLPFYDEESNIYITADCVLYNRNRLIDELNVVRDAPDGDVILAAYKKWGKNCASHLEGQFSFVIYDNSKNEIYVATDQFSQRCLFYHVRDGVFYFSTLFFPIPEATGLKFEENERWLVDTVSLRSPIMITEPKETSLKDIFKVVCGTYVTISISTRTDEVSMVETRYYDPNATIKTDWHMTLEQSEQLIKENMLNVMEDILQEQNDVAAQLSSGLDSSTVACSAALTLRKRGGKVYSYTSVPMKEAGIKNTSRILYDESEGVKAICNEYPNIIPEFVDCKDRHYLCEAEELVDSWELPCKSQQNAVWVDEIRGRARKRGLRIVLCGSTGNCTFSAGDYINTTYFYLSKMNFRKAYEVFSALKTVGFSRKNTAKNVIKSQIGYFKGFFDPDMKDCYANTVTKKTIGEKYNFTKRYTKIGKHIKPYNNMERMRNAFYLINGYSQIGEYDTKSSLRNGTLPVDPTRTVQIVNMCFRTPIYCFANYDYDRRLIRVGMKGIVPESIRTNVMQRGTQSGDNQYRLKLVWDKVKEKWEKVVSSEETSYYLDQNKVNELKKKIENGIENMEPIDYLLIADLYSFALFLQKLRNL